MSQGWITIHRQIRNHWIWEDKPFSYSGAWIDLLMMANHKEAKVPLGTELIAVERGSFITSELKLMHRWGWSKTKVRRFLDLLENDSMIAKKSDRKKTTLTICNYSLYQDIETTERPLKDRWETNKRPLKDTNNNENNENNGYIAPQKKRKIKKKNLTIEKDRTYTDAELEEMLLNKKNTS